MGFWKSVCEFLCMVKESFQLVPSCVGEGSLFQLIVL